MSKLFLPKDLIMGFEKKVSNFTNYNPKFHKTTPQSSQKWLCSSFKLTSDKINKARSLLKMGGQQTQIVTHFDRVNYSLLLGGTALPMGASSIKIKLLRH